MSQEMLRESLSEMHASNGHQFAPEDELTGHEVPGEAFPRPATYADTVTAGLKEPVLLMACPCSGRQGHLVGLCLARDAHVLIGQEDGRDYVRAERSFAVSLLREIQEDGRAAEALAPTASGEFWFVSLLHSVLRLAAAAGPGHAGLPAGFRPAVL